MPRVLVVAPFEDLPAQYIAMMNSIFSFQKGGVLVDSLVFCEKDCRVRVPLPTFDMASSYDVQSDVRDPDLRLRCPIAAVATSFRHYAWGIPATRTS
jgi:hypothetical protein